MGTAYVDGLFPEPEYRQQKHALESQLESLVIPEVNATEEAGRLVQSLPAPWADATPEERRDLFLAMLGGVYVEMKDERSVVAIKPKPAFIPIFHEAVARSGSGVVLLKQEPPVIVPGVDANKCLWWRRGRVELPVQEGFRSDIYRLSRR